MNGALPVVWEVQYRNGETLPWQLLAGHPDKAAAEERIEGLKRRYPKVETHYRVVKVTRAVVE